MRRVYVRLDREQLEQLAKVAGANRRHPADEAALLLEQVLRREEQPDKSREGQPCSR